MVNSAIGSSLVTSATGYWKPATPGTSAGTSASTAIGNHVRTEAVSVSKLGQALNGAAADLFKHLDSKARGTLEGLVNSGQISADEVVTGLKSLATQATFNRYVAERPHDDEDRQKLADTEAAWQKLQAYGSRMSGALSEIGRKTSDIQEAQQHGDITMDEMAERLRPVQDAFKSQIAEAEAAYGRPSDQTDVLTDASGFTKNVKGFQAAMSSLGPDSGFLAPFSPEGNAAEEKLQKLGFDAKVFGNALQSFAASVDIPGIGRGDGWSEPTGNAEPTAAPTEPSETASGAATGAATTTAASPAQKPAAAATTAGNAGNAQAALSMLQSALGSSTQKAESGNTPGAFAGVAAANADLTDGLLNALKAGTGPTRIDKTTAD
ncbi:hypothetical protein [Azospirillum canadense]|uniref:hypothetical protein n=1 Tax=Azospirillum canadense TaxID=403962 RepID=UPI00222609F8|nr:hypothetical protein [Azospirillum canadense]MCW2243016.1 hypothetical protein [Azospirillum canadense]